MKKRAQSFVEYTLLAAVAIIGLVVTFNSFLKGTVKDSFTRHFNRAKTYIVGEIK